MFSAVDAQSWIEAGPGAILMGAAFVEALVIRTLWKRVNELEGRQLTHLREYSDATLKREIATEGVLHKVAEALTALTEALQIDAYPEAPRRNKSRRRVLEELRREQNED